jgi:hypothetical protein
MTWLEWETRDLGQNANAFCPRSLILEKNFVIPNEAKRNEESLF